MISPSLSELGKAMSETLWEKGWDGHEQAQLLRFARLPLAEKLEWLEQAQRLAQQLNKWGQT